MKKHKFLSIFAIMFALVFALSICFFAACGNKEDNNDDTTVTIPDENEGNEEPGNEEPGSEEPGSEEPGSEEPGSEEPGSEEPGSEEPGDDELPSVSIDFSDSSTYSWIELTSATYTRTTEGSTVENTYNTVIPNDADKPCTSPNELLTVYGTNDPTSNDPMRIETDETETSLGTYLTTAGATQVSSNKNTGRYFQIDVSGYTGDYLAVGVTFRSGSSKDRSIMLSGTDGLKQIDDSVIAYSTSSAKTDEMKFDYVMEIPEDCDVLYLTCDANIYIYTIDVAVSSEAEPTPAISSVSLSAEPAEIETSGENTESTVTLEVKMENEEAEYAGGYTLTVAQNPETGDETVAEVTKNDDGTYTVTAMAAGAIEIEVRLWDDASKTDTCEITVVEASGLTATIAWYVENDTDLYVGQYVYLRVTIMEGDTEYTSTTYTWFSLTPGIATCETFSNTSKYSNAGKVTGVAAGTACVAVTLDDGSTWAVAITVYESEDMVGTRERYISETYNITEYMETIEN